MHCPGHGPGSNLIGFVKETLIISSFFSTLSDVVLQQCSLRVKKQIEKELLSMFFKGLSNPKSSSKNHVFGRMYERISCITLDFANV